METISDIDTIITNNPCQKYINLERYKCQLINVVNGVVILFLQSWQEKRKYKSNNCLSGRCALITSVNFIDNHSNGPMIVTTFVFSAMAIIVNLFYDQDLFTSSTPHFLKFFVHLLHSLFVSTLFLPVLACINSSTLLSSILGIIYVLVYALVNILRVLPICEEEHDSAYLLAYIVLVVLIHVVSGLVIVLQFLFRIYKTLESNNDHLDITPSKIYHQKEYVKKLLKPKSRVIDSYYESPQRALCSWKKKCIYQSNPGFYYSLTIVCSLSVGILLIIVCTVPVFANMIDLYQLCIVTLNSYKNESDVFIPNVIQIIERILIRESDFGNINEIQNVTVIDFVLEQLNIVFGSMACSIILPFIFSCINVIFILQNYKNNVHYMWKGDKRIDHLRTTNKKPASLVVSAIHFGGNQVAYLIIGYFLQSTFIFIVTFILSELIILPMKYDSWVMVKYLFNSFGSLIVFGLFINFIQYVLVRNAFLQNNGRDLGLDNRKGFFMLMYFMFFYNIVFQLLTTIRLIKGIVLGLWYFPRLDQSILPRSFESLDSGFTSYKCLLYLEELHNHPVVCTFIWLLTYQRNHGMETYQEKRPSHLPVNLDSSFKKQTRRRKIKNLWFLAWTLLHNESLISERKLKEI